MPSVILSNPLGADDAQRIGLDIREYLVGEMISVDDFVALTLIRTGYARSVTGTEEVLLTGVGAPTDVVGVDGQYYLDVLDEVLWGPKTNGIWPNDPIRPDRGVAHLTVSGGHLVITYSTGTVVDLGSVVGPAGPAATVAVGEVIAGQSPTDASVVNVGTDTAAVLDFVLPKGDKGDKGDDGDPGPPGTVAPATADTLGSVKLAGALGGTADEPTIAEKGQPNGVASLDAGGKVPLAQLPENIGSGGGSSDAGVVKVSTDSGAVVIDVESNWGIDSSGNPYHVDDALAPAAEAALLVPDPDTGAWCVWRPGDPWNTEGIPATPRRLARRDDAGKLHAVGGTSGDEVVVASQLADSAATTITTARQQPANTIFGPYTLQAADAGKLVVLNSASPVSCTVPPNSSVNYPLGTVIEVGQAGAGTVTLVAGSGVTISSPDGSLALRTQNSRARLIKTGTDTWFLSGDLARWQDNPPRARLLQTGDASNVGQTIPNAAYTTLSWGTTQILVGMGFSAGQPTRLTCLAAGTYEFTGACAFSINAAGGRLVGLKKNGVQINASASSSMATSNYHHVQPLPAILLDLAVNDYVEMECHQGSGAALYAPVNVNQASHFTAKRIA